MREQLFDLLNQPGDSLLGVFDGVNVILQHDLLGGMVKPDRRYQRRYATVQARGPA